MPMINVFMPKGSLTRAHGRFDDHYVPEGGRFLVFVGRQIRLPALPTCVPSRPPKTRGLRNRLREAADAETGDLYISKTQSHPVTFRKIKSGVIP